MNKLLFLVPFILVSCSLSTTFWSSTLSSDEISASKEIAAFYGGNCKITKTRSDDSTELMSVHINVTESDFLKHDTSNSRLHLGNIAYLFYKQLPNKSDYKKVDVTAHLPNGDFCEQSYSNAVLKEIKDFIPGFYNMLYQIKDKNYDRLMSSVADTNLLSYTELEGVFSILSEKFGKIEEYQFQGFAMQNTEEYGELLIMHTVQLREQIPISLYLIFVRSTKKLIGIQS